MAGTSTSDGAAEHGWRRILSLKRKKKQYKEELMGTITHLTSSLDSQMSLVRDLTQQNTTLLAQLNDFRSQASRLSGEKAAFDEKLKAAKEALEASSKRLHDTERQLQTANVSKTHLEARHVMLQKNIAGKDDQIHARDKSIAILKEKKKKLEDGNSTLLEALRELKEELSRSELRNAAYKLKTKSVEKDLKKARESLQQEQSEKLVQKQKVAGLSEAFYNLQSRYQELEHKHNTENDMLKFDVVMLTKTLKKKEEEIEKMDMDKRLILSYYSKVLERYPWFYKRNLNFHIQPDEIHPDVLHSVTLQNKVTRLENELYRKWKLVEELVRIVQEHDPEFRLTDPDFKCYFDAGDYSPPDQPDASKFYDADVLTKDPVVMTTTFGMHHVVAAAARGTDTQVVCISRDAEQ